MLRWEPEDEVYTAWVPSLPGCVTFGKTIEEALVKVPTYESVLERTTGSLPHQRKLKISAR
jgi:hypothetical protein